jgi:argininosuccinate lyase
MMATDLADYLVRRGATFREAHGAVGALVRYAEESGIELSDVPMDRVLAAHALFETDARDALGALASLGARNIEGGTGPDAVALQLRQAHESLIAASA